MNESHLVAEIYRTAAGIQSWPALLEILTGELEVSFAYVIGLRRSSGALSFAMTSSVQGAAATIDCLRMYQSIDPRAGGIARLPLAGLLKDARLGQEEGGDGRPFLRTFQLACGCRHLAAGRLLGDGETVAVVALVRGQQAAAFSTAEEGCIERLMEHLAAALDALRRAQQLRADTAVGELLLQRSQRPSLLLDANGTILFANAAARRLLDAGTVLVSRGGMVGAPFIESDERLRQVLARQRAPAPAGEAAGRIAFGLRDTATDRLMPACAWHLGHDDARGVFGASPATLLVLATSAAAKAPDPALLVEVFGLTPAEARVAVQLLGSRPPKAIAHELDITLATVRTYIRRLLVKTRSSDLRDLTRQVALAVDIGNL